MLIISGLILLSASVMAGPYDRFQKPKLWKQDWSDEFNGPIENDPCYSVQAKCLMAPNSTPVNCPAEFSKPLQGLNKCHWSVYAFYNYMDQDKIPYQSQVATTEKKGINAFDPSMVSFGDGEIILTGKKVETPNFDCGQDINGTLGKGCPFISGGIESQGHGNVVAGKFFKYGRFEVRAKLPTGRGSWPAHWLLPERSSNPSVPNWWPQAGEIDIMERWANWENAITHAVHGKTSETHVHQSLRSIKKDPYKSTYSSEYHIFAAEWDPSKISFFVDNRHVGTIEDNRILANGLPLKVPKDHAFFWILNSTIAHHCYAEKKFQPLPQFCSKDLTSLPSSLSIAEIPQDIRIQRHHIDYVRHYSECNNPQDSSCVESTLSPLCKNPCQGFGQFDGYNCYLGTVDQTKTAKKVGLDFIEQSSKRLQSYWGSIPPGRTGFTIGRSFYLTPVCNPTSTLPNCANPCPRGGSYDGRNCLIMKVPKQFGTFIYKSGFYYKRPSSERRCSFTGPYGVKNDGANCLLNYWAPDGSTPFIYDNNFYLKAACGNTTDWVSKGGFDAEVNFD